VRAPVGSIACAVHAKGKTALEVGHELARAASAALPDRVEDIVPGIREVLAEHGGHRRFSVLVDALDEAISPTEARLIVRGLLVPLVETCSDVGVQVLVGTRRRDDAGDLLAAFGAAHHDIDLDLDQYFALEDLTGYAQATLQMRGDERPGNPYTHDDSVPVGLAARIAEVAKPNFLIAGLIARTHGLHDTEPVPPAAIAGGSTVDSALADYLTRIPHLDGVPAAAVLTALAYAQSPASSLSCGTWHSRRSPGRASRSTGSAGSPVDRPRTSSSKPPPAV